MNNQSLHLKKWGGESKNNLKEVEENKKIRVEIGDIKNRKSPWNISKIKSEFL